MSRFPINIAKQIVDTLRISSYSGSLSQLGSPFACASVVANETSMISHPNSFVIEVNILHCIISIYISFCFRIAHFNKRIFLFISNPQPRLSEFELMTPYSLKLHK